ncbi:MAG TPA: Uma2 family endonuclease, partial [Caulobacteraceae bacterium]
MNVPLRKPWTQEEFFAWAETQETRYEFDGFQPVAMTGGFNNASAIGVNLVSVLRGRLRGSGCRPLGPDAGVETVNQAVRYPDALITCTKFDGTAKTVPGVLVVFEVVGAT